MTIKKIINKRMIFSLVAITIFLLIVGDFSKANAKEDIGKNVTISAKSTDGNSGGFSDNDGFWYPGRTLEKQFVVKNGNSKEIKFEKITVNVNSVSNFVLSKIFNPDEEIYKKFLKNLKVTVKQGENTLFEGTFQDFNKEGVLLNDPIRIGSNSEKELSLKIYFEEEAGNIFQNLRNLFNLNIQYILEDGTAVIGDVTHLPQTGGFLNLVTLTTIGLLFTGIGFMIAGHKEQTSLKKGGKSNG